nr:unnamed protein product [Callosobruchus analis]
MLQLLSAHISGGNLESLSISQVIWWCDCCGKQLIHGVISKSGGGYSGGGGSGGSGTAGVDENTYSGASWWSRY